MANLSRIERGLTSIPEYALHGSTLMDRIKKLEYRVNMVEKYRASESPTPVRQPPQSFSEANYLDIVRQELGSGNPKMLSSSKNMFLTLSEKFEEKMDNLDSRVSKLEEIDCQESKHPPFDALSYDNELRVLRSRITAVGADLIDLNEKMTAQIQRTSSGLLEAVNRLEKRVNHVESVIDVKPKPTNYGSAMERFEEQLNKALEDLKKVNEKMQKFSVDQQQLEGTVQELIASNKMEQLGFRELCKEVAEEVTNRLRLNRNGRKNSSQGDQTSTNSMMSLSRGGNLLQLINRIDSVHHQLKSELQFTRQNQEAENRKFIELLKKVEETANSASEETGNNRTELESVLLAEIKSRRIKEQYLQRCIKQMEVKVHEQSGMLYNLTVSAPPASKMPHRGVGIDQTAIMTLKTSVDNQHTSIKELQDRSFEIEEAISRNSAELRSKVTRIDEQLSHTKETVLKSLNSTIAELSRKFTMLHNEVVQMQISSSNQPSGELSINPQVRRISESLFATKLALMLKLRNLEKQDQLQHDKIYQEIAELRKLVKL